MAKRQLRELQRLMAWSWDSRVDEHPPGEKAMHDFENVLTFQLDNRRRRTTPASKDVAMAAAAATDSPAPPAAAAGATSSAKQPRKASAERSVKRASPAPGSGDTEAAHKDSAAPVAIAAADGLAAAGGVAATSPAAAVEATPAARHQPPLPQLSPAPPASCSAVTPAVLLAGVEQTPATVAGPFSGPTSTGHPAAALADAHFLPTPAPTPLPVVGAPCPLSSAMLLPGSCGLSAALAEAGVEAASAAAAVHFRQPAPRAVLTSKKRKAQDALGQGLVHGGSAAAVPELGVADAAAAAAGADDLLAIASSPPAPASLARKRTTSPAAAAAVPPSVQQRPQGDTAAVPMDTDDALAAATPPAQPALAGAAAPAPPVQPLQQTTPDCSNAAQPLAPVLASPVATAAAAAVPVAAAEVPTPVLQAFAAADQLVYHNPRPSSCPPLFKQTPGQSGFVPARVSSRSAGKSPLGKKRESPGGLEGKENSSVNGSAQGLAPRTAEPAMPPPVGLSGWKQQQLQQLSASFHSRQRRLLALLSACNRLQQQLPPAQPVPVAPAAKPGRGAVSAVAKPPLGPRAAALAMSRTLGRLKEQQAL